MAPDNRSDIDQLNRLLSAERSAVEAYNQCINHLTTRSVVVVLADLRQSHQRRVRQLSARVEELGGTPSGDSTPWATITELLRKGSNAIGDKATVLALEQAEARARGDYQLELEKLAPQTRQFIATTILPERQRSRDMLTQLNAQL